MTKIKISPDQNTVTSKHGTSTFFPVKADDNKTCHKCWFGRSPISLCKQIPCMNCDRKDGKNGYFSIHEMP